MKAVDRSQHELGRNTLAGSMAVGSAVGLMNPLDTLRVRWQVLTPNATGSSSSSSSLLSFFASILRDEGLWQGLWRHALTTNMMSMVCNTLSIRLRVPPYASI